MSLHVETHAKGAGTTGLSSSPSRAQEHKRAVETCNASQSFCSGWHTAHRCWPMQVTTKPYIKMLVGQRSFLLLPWWKHGGERGAHVPPTIQGSIDLKTERSGHRRSCTISQYYWLIEKWGPKKGRDPLKATQLGLEVGTSSWPSSALSTSALALDSRSDFGTPGPTSRRCPHNQACSLWL